MSGASSGAWVAVMTHPNCEMKAVYHLARQGYDVYLPRYLKRVTHARRSQMLPRPLFPRYLFLRLAESDAWRPVYSTVGVSGLVSAGDRPARVPLCVVDEIRAREDMDGYVCLNRGRSFRPGEAVRVEIGGDSELAGIFESCDDGERVTVLLNLLGRQVRARMPLEAIRASA